MIKEYDAKQTLINNKKYKKYEIKNFINQNTNIDWHHIFEHFKLNKKKNAFLTQFFF